MMTMIYMNKEHEDTFRNLSRGSCPRRRGCFREKGLDGKYLCFAKSATPAVVKLIQTESNMLKNISIKETSDMIIHIVRNAVSYL